MTKPQGTMAITAYQLGSGLVGVMVGLGPLFVSRILTHENGRDAWIILLLGVCILIGSSVIAVTYASKFPHQTFLESTESVFGKPLSWLLALGWIPLGIVLAGLTLWYMGQVIRTFILFETPTPLITLGLILLSVYAATKGLSVIFRVTEIIFILSFGFIFFSSHPSSNMRIGVSFDRLVQHSDGTGERAC